MKKILILFAIALISTVTSHAQWTQCNGPHSGIVKALEANDRFVFMSIIVDSGYTDFYRSSDDGLTWTEILPDFGRSRTYKQFIVNKNTLIAVLADSLYRSTDNGENWTNAGYNNFGSITLIDTKLYAWT